MPPYEQNVVETRLEHHVGHRVTVDRRQGGLGPRRLAGVHPRWDATAVPEALQVCRSAAAEEKLRPGARPRIVVVWHKQGNLRLHDNEAVSMAHLTGLPVLHVHIFDSFWFGRSLLAGFPKTGALRAQFWRECVEDLRGSLAARSQNLWIRSGTTSAEAFQELMAHFDIVRVFTLAEVCSEELAIERAVAGILSAGRQAEGPAGRADDRIVRCWGYTLHHIEDLPTSSRGSPDLWITAGLTFAQFKKEVQGCRIRKAAAEWHTASSHSSLPMQPAPVYPNGDARWGALPSLEDLGFVATDIASVRAAAKDPRIQFPWTGGESFALARLEALIWGRQGLKVYVSTTDWSEAGKCDATPEQTSKLSPYLAFGCVSPRLVHDQILAYEGSEGVRKGSRGLVNSLLWRDFFRFIVYFAWGDRMYHLFGPMSCGSEPGGHRIPQKWCCKHYNNVFGGSDPRLWTWGRDRSLLAVWTEGRTGYPFVDAGMLELRATGYMRHLNREVVGWFFVGDLQLDWRLAAEWFETCLVDYDCVLNWGSWAYFILTQLPSREDDRPGGGPKYTLPHYSPYLATSQLIHWGEEHDPGARYVTQWLPQLAGLPALLAREPWRVANDDDDGLDVGETDVGEDGWACESCTLINAVQRRRCEACGSARQQLPGTGTPKRAPHANGPLGIYSSPPVVPPPPQCMGELGDCEGCGRCNVLVFIAMDGLDDGCYCGSCWATWAQQRRDEPLVARAVVGATPSQTVWDLVPAYAMPGQVSPAAAASLTAVLAIQSETQVIPKPLTATCTAAAEKKANRWKRRGELETSRSVGA